LRSGVLSKNSSIGKIKRSSLNTTNGLVAGAVPLPKSRVNKLVKQTIYQRADDEFQTVN